LLKSSSFVSGYRFSDTTFFGIRRPFRGRALRSEFFSKLFTDVEQRWRLFRQPERSDLLVNFRFADQPLANAVAGSLEAVRKHPYKRKQGRDTSANMSEAEKPHAVSYV